MQNWRNDEKKNCFDLQKMKKPLMSQITDGANV